MGRADVLLSLSSTLRSMRDGNRKRIGVREMGS